MYEKNFVIIFRQDEMNRNVFKFDSVVLTENDVIITDNQFYGKNLTNEETWNINQEFLNMTCKTVESQDIEINRIFRRNGFFYLKVTGDLYTSLTRDQSDPEQAKKRISTILNLIGKKIKYIYIDNNYHFHIITNEGKLNDFPINNIEVLQTLDVRRKKKSMNENAKYKNNTTHSKGDKNTGKVDINLINPDEIIDKIKEKMIGQDKAIKDAVYTLFMNQMLINMGDEDALTVGKANILIDGPTGTGKTMLMKEISKNLSLPMTIASATSFSTVGYKGNDLESILIKLLDAANGDVELAQKGIIVFDEFDKLGTQDSKNELAIRKALQEELLAYISGGKFDINYNDKTVEFDTSKITFVALGAFTNLRERKIEENEKKYNTSMGFSTDQNKDYEKTYDINSDDYITEGLHRG